jgi:DNA-binding transcriptional regulator YdaS (Cro superfamily)
MSKELHPTVKDIVPAVANAIARKFRGWVEPDDLRQELYVWALARQDHYKDQFDEEHKEKREHNERRFASHT